MNDTDDKLYPEYGRSTHRMARSLREAFGGHARLQQSVESVDPFKIVWFIIMGCALLVVLCEWWRP